MLRKFNSDFNRITLGAIFGLVTGNFIFQAFFHRDWLLAADRSFFQALAVLTYVFIKSRGQNRC